ncbi:MAG: SpoIIE family protein phosphatase, partial [Candidatus Korobacteraceae bacterium]
MALLKKRDLTGRLRVFVPRSQTGQLAALFLGFGVVFLAVRWLLQGASSPLADAIDFGILLSGGAAAVLLIILGGRWVRRRLMWKLRNRLIITYIFIAVIPVVLLLLMGGLSTYLLGGQIATYIANSDLRTELNGLAAMNARMATDMAAQLPDQGRVSERLLRRSGPRFSFFPTRETVVWYRGVAVQSEGARPVPPPRDPSTWETRGFTVEHGQILLRVSHTVDVDGEKLTAISSVPLDQAMLDRVAAGLGVITISVVNDAEGQAQQTAEPIRAGVLPDAANLLDFEITGPVVIPVSDWLTGQTRDFGALLIVNTRPSLLKARLFRVVGESLNLGMLILTVTAVVFGVVELLALWTGIRLTRNMVRSVTRLYDATQNVEHGDLTHRIEVERDDQLAALERSFNTMTQSLESLIAEQREKQRLDDDLAIAQEVQSQLFPRQAAELEGLEVFGVCKPARTVSGDYYDFLRLGPDQLLIALGDVSGKGISAALLMATIHSAVRAYSLQDVPASALAVSAGSGTDSSRRPGVMWPPAAGAISPSELLCMLNRHLYRSTTPEKYATLFLAVYHHERRILSYANTGHLPPLLLRHDG